MSDLLAHADNSLEIRTAMQSLQTGVERVRRVLGAPSATPPMRKAAKKELRAVVAMARALIREL